MSLSLFILFLLDGPLLLQHCLLDGFFLSILLTDHLLRVILPGENIKSFLNFFFLFLSLSFLASQFLLSIEHPKLCIDLFLDNLFFHFLSLVHELLFSFELGASSHEMRFFAPQVICLHFEFSINCSLNMLFFFCLSLNFYFSESLRHFLPYLLRCFQVC